MILLFAFILIFVIYVIIRQYRLYNDLKKCGLHPQFDIFGWNGLFWLDSCDIHKEITKKCHEIGYNTFSLLRGSRPVVVVSDIDLIHSISTQHYDCFHSRIPEIFDDDPISSATVHVFAARGERWKRLRTLTSYALSTTKLKTLFPTIDKCANGFLDHVNKLGDSRKNRVVVNDSHRLFQNHTSFVMVQCAYGYFGKDSSHDNNNFLKYVLNAFGAMSDYKNGITERLSYILPELKLVFKQFLNFFDNTNRQEFLDQLYCLMSVFYLDFDNDNKPYSLLKFFYDHRDHTSSKVKENGNGKIDMKNVRVEKRISNQEIFAQCKFLAVAGFDTTANTMTLLFNFLAIFPDIQDLLYESEIKDQSEPLSYDSLCEKSFLQNCIFETLRLYPHASPLQQRICTANCTIDEKYHFKTGYEIILNPWMAHHDEKIWGSDVENFRPSRFDDLTETQKRAFMPFGVGPRQCVGMRFALLELKTTIFRVLQTYSIHPSDKTKLDVKMTARDTGTIWPESDLGLILKKRNVYE